MVLLAIDRRNGQVARRIKAQTWHECMQMLPMSYQTEQYKIKQGGKR